MPNQDDLDLKYLRMALLNGLESSKDPNRKIGAVIVSADGRAISCGYNGFGRNIPDSAMNWERPRKYELVVHAEPNAIVNAPFDTKGSTLYTALLRPCHRCMGLIINAGIARVVWSREEVAFANDQEEIFDLYRPLVKMKEYLVSEDPISLSIIDLYGYKHDGYKKEMVQDDHEMAEHLNLDATKTGRISVSTESFKGHDLATFKMVRRSNG